VTISPSASGLLFLASLKDVSVGLETGRAAGFDVAFGNSQLRKVWKNLKKQKEVKCEQFREEITKNN
jgi:hypothetical protein